MRLKYTIPLFCALLFIVASCSKAITVTIINRSQAPIDIEDHGKLTRCNASEMVSFIPERTDHDIKILAQASSLSYDIAAMPAEYLDIKNHKRLLLIFATDDKLYILKPTDAALDEAPDQQPRGYPLIPK